jgi:hypothetical protein
MMPLENIIYIVRAHLFTLLVSGFSYDDILLNRNMNNSAIYY